jgi:hypothetical protein
VNATVVVAVFAAMNVMVANVMSAPVKAMGAIAVSAKMYFMVAFAVPATI